MLIARSDFHLVSHPLCPYVQRAVIVLTEKGIKHRRTYIDLANKPDWFLDISPLGKTPVLQTKGQAVFESQVIAEYLNDITPGSLHPHQALARARHRSWIEYASATLNTIAGFYNAKDEASFEQKRLELRDKFVRLEGEIKGPWFGGAKFNMIDGIWGTVFRYFDVFDQIADFAIFDDLERVKAWRARIAGRPSVKTAVPEGYNARLHTFLINRQSFISDVMAKDVIKDPEPA